MHVSVLGVHTLIKICFLLQCLKDLKSYFWINQMFNHMFSISCIRFILCVCVCTHYSCPFCITTNPQITLNLLISALPFPLSLPLNTTPPTRTHSQPSIHSDSVYGIWSRLYSSPGLLLWASACASLNIQIETWVQNKVCLHQMCYRAAFGWCPSALNFSAVVLNILHYALAPVAI